MKKILVPTDFSVNSKAGVRFALHWATKQKLELVFVHVLHVLRATQWTDDYFIKYEAQEEKICRIKFEKFITDICQQMKARPGVHSFLIIKGISPDIALLDYCKRATDIDCICISTRGAGQIKKMLGTHTGNLITKSPVPVLAVPKNYRVAAISRIMYASDFSNYSEELQKVTDFAKQLKVPVDVVHFTWPGEMMVEKKLMEAASDKKFRYGINLHIENNDVIHSLVENIQRQIKKIRPSVVIMFTNQERTLFQKFFFSSKAEELSFVAKTPLLVFKKEFIKHFD